MFTIRVFEHQTLRAGDVLTFHHGGSSKREKLEQRYIIALLKLYDQDKRPFFVPARNGIRFTQWVGVLKVLDLTIEILPKADNRDASDDEHQQNKWQSILIGMLNVCRSLDTPSLSNASLRLKNNSILDLYIEQFIDEVTNLLRLGLVKRYRKEESNDTSLKGRLLFQKHLAKNIVHKELFYISKATYDCNHLLHQVLSKAIKIIPLICNNQELISKCHQLQFNFPEFKDINVEESTFTKLQVDRKTAPYQTAIQIAKLLTLNYHPDVSSGMADSIAILFDMNKLWEEYIYRMLQKANDGTLIIHSQRSVMFYNHQSGNRYIKPDIVIERPLPTGSEYTVIDTKWKNISGQVENVSVEDLRQMFAYHHYFDAAKCYLLYPGEDIRKEGRFGEESFFKKTNLGDKACGVIVSKAWNEKDGSSALDKNLGSQLLRSLELIA